MGKGEGSISIIGGADGPTSIFIAGKSDKVKLTTRIQNYFRKLKSNRVKKRITANPHTLEEVVELMKREYGAEEVSQHSFNYQEQRKCLKASLVMRHRPDLLGELMDLEPPERDDVEALKTFFEQIQKREKIAAEIADDILPLDFHIYEIKCPAGCDDLSTTKNILPKVSAFVNINCTNFLHNFSMSEVFVSGPAEQKAYMESALLAEGVDHRLRLLRRIVVDAEDAVILLAAQAEESPLVPSYKV